MPQQCAAVAPVLSYGISNARVQNGRSTHGDDQPHAAVPSARTFLVLQRLKSCWQWPSEHRAWAACSIR